MYCYALAGDLKVQNTAQLKYVTEDDLCGIGMTKPEMRRLKKYFQKHFPQNYLSKFKKMLLPRREEQLPGSLAMLPEERQDRPPIRVPNKHMIPADAIIVNKELGMDGFLLLWLFWVEGMFLSIFGWECFFFLDCLFSINNKYIGIDSNFKNPCVQLGSDN